MTRKGRRLAMIAVALCVVGAAVGLALFALRGSIAFSLSPSEIAVRKVEIGSRLRIGGLVAEGSVVKSGDDQLRFAITDGANQIKVSYAGLPPDLFREGQGVVAEGVLEAPDEFHADQIFAKHDERYMPREVVESLKKQGRWQEGANGQSGTPKP
jgi:cytochrome c-type biogenesis protein CcmE